MPADLGPALRALADLDGVAEAAEAARLAAEQLRWHPGLRRRWREARAETAVRAAVAGAALDGAVVPVGWLRAQVAAGGTARPDVTPTEAAVLAAWRAQVHVGALLADLGATQAPVAPAGEALAGLHRDLTAHLVPAVLPADVVGRPRAAARDRLETVLGVLAAADAPALVRVAVVHAELATGRPFTPAAGQLARAVARLVTVRSGLEPTGVAVLDAGAAADPDGYRRALAGYATGTPAGVAGWLGYQGRAVVTGCAAGAEVAAAVLAGRT